jgi:hypothetical protein
MSLINPRKRWLYVWVALAGLAMLFVMYSVASYVPRLSPGKIRAAREEMILHNTKLLNRYDSLVSKVNHLVEEEGYTLNEAMAHMFWKENRSFAEKSRYIARGKSGRYVLLNGDGYLCVFRRLQDGSIVYISDDIADSNDVEETPRRHELPKAVPEEGKGQ